MKKRYSKYIIPISIIAHLFIINATILFVSDKNYSNALFLIYINSVWFVISYYTGFYKIYRYTKIINIAAQTITQFFAFVFAYFAYFGIFKEGLVVDNQLRVFLIIFSGITIFKLLYFYFLKLYRKEGLNFRNVVIIGSDSTSKKITEVFNSRNDLGYRFKGFFTDKKSKSANYLGTINDSYSYILDNEIDEIYCAISLLDKNQIKELQEFANNNDLKVNLIPESNELYNKNFLLEYYDTVPVLKVKKLPFERVETRITKRIFDIIFSLFVIIFILSWLIPLLWIFIKIESKGPVLFKQSRQGLDGENFICYKFRSMRINKFSDKVHTVKNDKRITKVGAFIRRTSMDELPQFFNVLQGDMSVVGPRPHMNLQSLKFEKEIDNYFVRNAVKPGITGLAQTRGYRGEIIKKSDIENRVRLDVFYIENWSFLLDVKIILETIFNTFKKDEKVY